MRKIRLLALILAMVMVVAILASCNKKEEEPAPEAPEEPMTFATLINPAAPTLENVVSKMESVTELEGYTRWFTVEGDEWYSENIYHDNNSEFRFFVKTDAETGFNTYKVFSLRNSKVVKTLTDTAEVTYNLGILSARTPTFYAYKTEKVWLNDEHSDFTLKHIRTLYDANGNSIMSKTNEGLDTPYFFHDWVIINRDVYTVEKTTGVLTKKTSIPRNVKLLGDSSVTFVNNNFYIRTSLGFIVYDADFNYVGEWFKPVNVPSYRYSVLNNGNVLVQYDKRLEPTAEEYDYYTGNYSDEIIKYDLVTEIFSITDQSATKVECDRYIETLYCNNYLRTQLSVELDLDPSKYLGDFENVAITYPIQDKKINSNDNVIDFVLVDNNAVLGRSVKLVPNQISLPEKISENLYQIRTTYGYALTDVEGNIIKQITTDIYSLTQVGEYLYDEDAIYNLKYETVYNFSEKNAEIIGTIDNTIFVKQYPTAEKKADGDYTVYAFSNGASKEITKYTKDGEKNKIFALNTDLNIYSLYDSETKLYTYYNADGTAVLKDFANNIFGGGSYEGGLAYYYDESGETPVIKYVAIIGNFNKD